MKIAVTYENGEVFQHFGHTQCFKVYEAEAGEVSSQSLIKADGEGHGALAGLLREAHVDTLICGGIGGGARQALSQAGIALYPGVTGEADKAVEALLKGTLSYNPDTLCAHHGEHHGQHQGDCASHHCGGHCAQ